jgi:hypothetical protein
MDFVSKWQTDVVMDPSLTGVIAGVVHHLLVQYPNQAKLFTTLYAIALMNAGFLILMLGSKDEIRSLQILKALVTFQVFYVGTLQSVDLTV